MTPLQKVAMGLVIVVIDPDLAGYDAVPDVLGWMLIGWGLHDLRRRLSSATSLAVLIVISAAVSMLLFPSSRADSLQESTGWYLSLPFLVFCFVLCGSVALLLDRDRPRAGRHFSRLRWVFLLLMPVPALLYGGSLDPPMLLVGIVGAVAVFANLYLIYLLFKASRLPAVLGDDVAS